MKRLLTIGLLIIFSFFPLHAQQPQNGFSIRDYKPPFFTKLYYQNFLFANSDIKWTPKPGFSIADLSVFSSPKKFYQLDLLVYYHAYFKIGVVSVFQNSGPFQLNYLVPFGLRLPVLNGRRYSVSINSNFYLFPVNTGYNIFFNIKGNPLFDYRFNKHDGYNCVLPRFIDPQVRIETNILGFSAFAGYRIQVTPWQFIKIDLNKLLYSGNLSGPYVGLSIGLKFSKFKNSGLEQWNGVLSDRSASRYEKFISQRPQTPYSTNAILTKIALEDTDPGMRLAAVHKISIQNVLIKVALEDASPKLRLAAVEKISDQNALAEVAIKDKDSGVRQAAARKVNDQNMLSKLALEANDTKVRSFAADNLTDQSILIRVALQDADPSIRLAAAKRLNDQENLSRLGLESSDEKVRSYAVDKITDQDVLKKIVAGDPLSNIRFVALERITDQEYLVKVACEEGDLQMRLAAISKVKDQSVLLKLALEDKNEEVRALSFKSIDDQAVLMTIVNQANIDWTMRSSAFNRLNNESLLEVGKLAKDPAVDLAAQIRLGKTTWKEEFLNKPLSDLIGAIAIVQTPLPTSDDIVELCHNFIAKGDASRIPELKDLLFRFGNVSLAEDYMNCGNSVLEQAGQKWGRDHGYNVRTGPGSSRVRWGEKK